MSLEKTATDNNNIQVITRLTEGCSEAVTVLVWPENVLEEAVQYQLQTEPLKSDTNQYHHYRNTENRDKSESSDVTL